MTPPTFGEMIANYGPYLGLVLLIVISYMIMQYRWFKKVITAKDEEIARLVKHEEALNTRLLHIIDEKIGHKKAEQKKKETT